MSVLGVVHGQNEIRSTEQRAKLGVGRCSVFLAPTMATEPIPEVPARSGRSRRDVGNWPHRRHPTQTSWSYPPEHTRTNEPKNAMSDENLDRVATKRVAAGPKEIWPLSNTCGPRPPNGSATARRANRRTFFKRARPHPRSARVRAGPLRQALREARERPRRGRAARAKR